ncbi:MAG TPA: hypothetical protein VFJ58_27350 [Armatimonadota bacterium]|nr:hypothetical protein [Armatimonadota bacterium]
MEGRVKEALLRRFPGAELELEYTECSGRIIGRISWRGFTGLDQMDRQEKLWQALREELGADASGVSIILTYTPRELKLMAAA